MSIKPLSRRELTKKILEVRRDLPEAYIEKLIDDKLKSSKGFLTEEGAAFLLAQELGVKVVEEIPTRFQMNLGSLMENLKDVSVSARIINLYGFREFIRRDGTKGKVLRATIGDSTGIADLVVWDEKADAFKAQPNQLVRINHGYTKRGLSGRLEIHVGRGGEIQLLEEGLAKEGSIAPPIFRSIASLKAQENSINLKGEILELSSVSIFQRPEGQGKLLRAKLKDETGIVNLIIWNDKVDLYASSLKKGSIVRIYDARTKAGLDQKPEVHLDGRSKIEIEGFMEPQKISYASLAQLPDKGTIEGLSAQIVGSTPIREFSRRDGRKGKMASLLIRDEKGFARLVLWDDKAELARSLEIGNWILIRRGNIRLGARGLEIHIDAKGDVALEPRSQGLKERHPLESNPRISSIKDLRVDSGYVTVEGTVYEPPSLREVVTHGGRKAKVATFSLKDSTGILRVSLWDRLAEEALGLKKGDVVRVENFFLKGGLGNELEASSSEFSSLRILGKSSETKAPSK
ncbi:MAG: OB-fold nucleic acid binding domain-containing protein [Candidatus Bathyarchaeia archaeon]